MSLSAFAVCASSKPFAKREFCLTSEIQGELFFKKFKWHIFLNLSACGMQPSITTNHLAFTILFDSIATCEYFSTCFRYTFLQSSSSFGENPTHYTRKKDIFSHSPTLFKGRGFKVLGKTLSRTHNRRITRESS